MTHRNELLYWNDSQKWVNILEWLTEMSKYIVMTHRNELIYWNDSQKWVPSSWTVICYPKVKIKPQTLSYPRFAIVVGFAWSKGHDCYAGSNVATGRVSRGGHIKGDDPEKRDTLVIWVRGCTLDQLPYHTQKKSFCWETLKDASVARTVGKPKTRWEVIKRDTLQILGIWGYRRQAGDRSGGASWGRLGPRRDENPVVSRTLKFPTPEL